jgi:hypothetical protein
MGEIACLFLSKLTNSNDFCGETGLTESKLSNLTKCEKLRKIGQGFLCFLLTNSETNEWVSPGNQTWRAGIKSMKILYKIKYYKGSFGWENQDNQL